MTDQTSTPARRRAEALAALVPAGATYEITEDNDAYLDLAQLVVRGSIDTICITINNRKGKSRTRASGDWWFNSNPAKSKPIKVRWMAYQIRNLFI